MAALIERIDQGHGQVLHRDIAGLAIGLHQRRVLTRAVLAGAALRLGGRATVKTNGWAQQRPVQRLFFFQLGQHVACRSRAGLDGGRKIRRIHHLLAIHKQAARAAHHDETLDACGLHALHNGA